MRSYKVSEYLRDELEFVLKRDNVPYHFTGDRICVPLSGKAFHLAVKDALCEKERQGKIPVYSRETVLDTEKFNRLCALNKTGAFHILSGDRARMRF